MPESELKLVNDKYFKSTVEARKGARDKEVDSPYPYAYPYPYPSPSPCSYPYPYP